MREGGREGERDEGRTFQTHITVLRGNILELVADPSVVTMRKSAF